MRVTVFGVGGVGGFLAARLGGLLNKGEGAIEALSVVARGDHLRAIDSRGLTLLEVDGSERTVRPTAASENPAELPPADLVILGVKGYGLDDALEALRPAVAPGAAVLPLLNGADIHERVRSRLPDATVLPGCIYISAFIEAPGVIRHAGGPGKVFLGPDTGSRRWEPDRFLKACTEARIPAEWREDVLTAVWEKFLFIAPFSLVTAVSGESLGGVLASDTLRQDARSIIGEAAAIAGRKGVALPSRIVEATIKKAEGFAPETRTSFQRDIEAGKALDERDSFSGTILRLGEEFGLPTPVTGRYAEALPPTAAEA